MNTNEIYEGLRLLVRNYIAENRQNELLELLNKREKENDFPPGKGILHHMQCDSNGVKLKPEHQDLYDEICRHCV